MIVIVKITNKMNVIFFEKNCFKLIQYVNKGCDKNNQNIFFNISLLLVQKHRVVYVLLYEFCSISDNLGY